MKYIWGIHNIYLTPSAILFSQRSYVPPSPELGLESLELNLLDLKLL